MQFVKIQAAKLGYSWLINYSRPCTADLWLMLTILSIKRTIHRIMLISVCLNGYCKYRNRQMTS